MVTQETARKYEVVEDLPGVGPSTADKLKELGFHTVESLATATIRELVPAGIGEKQAAKIIGVARDSISLSFIRAEIGRATSELQSRGHLVCRLLLEKKKKEKTKNNTRDMIRAT